MEPAWCAPCRDLVVLNYNDPDPRCPHCRGKAAFYNDPLLRREPVGRRKEREVIPWGEFLLPDADYLCPRCGGMRMKFFVTGTWD
jgi:DNA-directed RNA polymerase subunit RPC12/RpoP